MGGMSMTNRMKKIISILLMLVLSAASVPVQEVKAAGNGPFYYCPAGGEGQYCKCINDAFMGCHAKGGIIHINEDVELDFPDFVQYGCLNKDTILVIGGDATVTIGRNGFRMDGMTQVLGTIDMEQSEGILYGEGSLKFPEGGKLIKRSYSVDQKGEKICLEGTDLTYGQTLSDAVVTQDRINWRASVEGSWCFRNPEQIPQAGTRNYDVVFEPKYPMTYEKKEFDQCGQVTTRQTVPVRDSYEPLRLHIGETLHHVRPDIRFVSPVNGEEVKGSFSFDQAEQTLLNAGEQQIKGIFTPVDANYAAAEEYLKVYVQMTVPKVTKEPLVRSEGVYGQTLEQIQFVPGTCVNPYNNHEVTGTWEWKNAAERLVLGTKTYAMLFLPDIQGYEAKEIQVEVTTNPKGMEEIEWPSCTDLVYGERLSDSQLSFVKNEYGTFSWQNENMRPSVKNEGAIVVFRPANADIYDWSRLAGYDKESHTVSFTIPIQVRPLKGELPAIQATEVEEGGAVSGSALRISGTDGQVHWQQPEQIIKHSGWYPVYFIPENADDYDWSSYAPDEQGRICLKVYVEAREPSEPVQEPEVVPTEEPAEKPGNRPDNSYNLSQSSTTFTSDKEKREDQQGDSSDKPATFVITQMISKISKIRTPAVSVKKTSWVSRRREKDQMRLHWKKIKGVRYQIQYGVDKRWKTSRKKTVRGTSVTIRGLKRRQKYYVRIRCVKVRKGRNYYSKWTKRQRL